MKRKTTYRVRDAAGRELDVPSLEDLGALYRQGLLEDDDLVRRERSDRWERVGDLGALRGVRDRRAAPRWIWNVLFLAVALAAALVMLLRR
jgi:hypothetical protein